MRDLVNFLRIEKLDQIQLSYLGDPEVALGLGNYRLQGLNRLHLEPLRRINLNSI